MNSVEDGYKVLADYVLAFIGSRKWDRAGCSMRIFSQMVSGSQWLFFGKERDEMGGFENKSEALWAGLDAALYLRDHLLKTTGDRIWGLTFTLYPDGKFRIDYDYNKPEDYEETEETIDVDLNQNLLSKLNESR